MRLLIVTIITAATLILTIGVPPVAAQDYCDRFIRAYTLYRRVHGPVDQECEFYHTRPWGNWGVNSNYQNKDNDQFPGWMLVNNQRQWNSCTSQYSSPSPTWYNDPRR